MIGSCDCCDRTNVPVGKMVAYGIETTACFVCSSHGIDPDPDPYGEFSVNASYADLIERLRECYDQRELPTWGEIHDAAKAIKHLITLNRLMVPGISEWKERAEHAEAVLAEQDMSPCPYAIDGCILENNDVGPCLCANPVASTMPSAECKSK